MLVIPKQPEELELRVDHFWNGSECDDETIHASVFVSQTDNGIRIRAEAPMREDLNIPDAPVGRLDGLWEHDVVECFLVGPDHNYLEVELGAGGHWLVLSFDEVRQRSNSHEDLRLDIRDRTLDTKWSSEVVIPWSLVPKPVRAINAFVIAKGQFLSAYKLPGEVEDFHQPDEFPEAKLAE